MGLVDGIDIWIFGYCMFLLSSSSLVASQANSAAELHLLSSSSLAAMSSGGGPPDADYIISRCLGVSDVNYLQIASSDGMKGAAQSCVRATGTWLPSPPSGD